MITLTLTRGEDESSLAASGTCYDGGHHKTFTIAGNFGIPEEDGKVPLELSFVCVGTFCGMFTGKFDPEEKSLRGSSTPGQGSDVIVFKRSPYFVRFYPSPPTITARRRWEFAMATVLDKIRRDSWSPAYILRRIKDGKRYMELSIRKRYYGRKLNAGEREEYSKLLSALFPGDPRFYASLIRTKLVDVPI